MVVCDEHDRAALREPLAILGQQHRAAAGREDDCRRLAESVSITSRSRIAKARLALVLENVGDIDAGARLDFGVAVDERQSEQPGQCPPDGGLARAHRADQEHVALGAGMDDIEAHGF